MLSNMPFLKCNVLRYAEGWEETQAADGRMLYVNQEEGSSTEEHPLDEYFKELLERERAKREPYYSTQPIWYKENSVVRYRNGKSGVHSHPSAHFRVGVEAQLRVSLFISLSFFYIY